jgi:RNA polymerase sigma-70 factor (ECF subfamily)
MSPKISQTFAARLIAQLPGLRRYAMALCGNRELVDDLVQDAIERALSRAPRSPEPERLGAWLRTVVHNLLVDELRRRRRRGVRVDLADMENDLALSTTPADHLASRDVSRAMANLSIEHRQILLLIGVEQLSYQEVAEELRVPLGTVMSRVARARAALRAALDPEVRALPAEQRS